MKHNCYGRDREMILEYRCTKCGEVESAEFLEDKVLELEELKKQHENEIDDLRNTIAEQFEFEKLIQSVEFSKLLYSYQKLNPKQQEEVVQYIKFLKSSKDI
jgi:hypothetical protein